MSALTTAAPFASTVDNTPPLVVTRRRAQVRDFTSRPALPANAAAGDAKPVRTFSWRIWDPTRLDRLQAPLTRYRD